jgi:hypothetical protein
MTKDQSVSMILIRFGGHGRGGSVVDWNWGSCNEGKKANQGHKKMEEHDSLSGEEGLVPAKTILTLSELINGLKECKKEIKNTVSGLRNDQNRCS